MRLNLRVWRQPSPETEGAMVAYRVDDATPEMSFLQLLDILNEQLIAAGKEAIAFDHDCREGICGSCGVVINGQAHGQEKTTTAHATKASAAAPIPAPADRAGVMLSWVTSASPVQMTPWPGNAKAVLPLVCPGTGMAPATSTRAAMQ
jgi:hypothetical protein